MASGFRKFFKGLRILPTSSTAASEKGDIEVLSTGGKINYHNGTTVSPVVTEAHASQGSSRLMSKDLDDATTAIVDSSDTTKKIKFDAAGTTGTTTTITGSQTSDRTLTLPDATDTLAGLAATQTFTNKTFTDASTTFQDDGDNTKKFKFQASGISTGQTRTFTLADFDGTLATLAGTETFTNKTLTSPKINENVALTTTATKLNYLTSATGTTGTASTNVVFSTSPTLTTPTLASPTINNVMTLASGISINSAGTGSNGIIQFVPGDAAGAVYVGLSGAGMSASVGDRYVFKPYTTADDGSTATLNLPDLGSGGTGRAMVSQGTHAAGDIYYNSDASTSSVMTRLAAGTAGHYLRMSSGVPSWQAPGFNVVVKSDNYTATDADDLILIGSTHTITLPTVTGRTGKQFIIKKIANETTTVTIATTGGETIDGVTTQKLKMYHDHIHVIATSVGWVCLKKPMVYAKYTSNAALSYGDNTTYYTDFEDVVIDTHNAVSGAGTGLVTTTNTGWKYICPMAGLYQVTSSIMLTSAAGWDLSELGTTHIRVNDVAKSGLSRIDNYTEGYMKMQGTGMVLCAANDRIEIDVYQNSGGAIAAHNDGLYNYVEIIRIGD